MGDNVAVTAGAGTNIATDERTIASATVHIQRVGEIGAATGATGQVTVSNSSGDIVAARETRKRVVIANRQTVAIFVNPGGTATTADLRLDPGETLTLRTTAAVKAITAAVYSPSGDAKAHYIEEYD